MMLQLLLIVCLFWAFMPAVSAASPSDKAFFGIEHPTANTHLRVLQSAQTDTFLPFFSAVPITLPSLVPNNVDLLSPTINHNESNEDTHTTIGNVFAASETWNENQEPPPSRREDYYQPGCPTGEENALECSDCGGGIYHVGANGYICKGVSLVSLMHHSRASTS